jgi:DNA modification methylase
LAAEKKKIEQVSDKYKPVLYVGDGIKFTPKEKYDLLLTDPPYSTDVDNIEKFVNDWLYKTLDNVKDTGFAYVFIGNYPEEVKAYLCANTPEHIKLQQILVWRYDNTLAKSPKDKYDLNCQFCLFYRGINSPDPDFENVRTEERLVVQTINAPDGRQGDRYHAWQKPMEIAERFIRHSTEQDMTVFDPFACTGTFLLAAAKLGRKSYGFEINPEHAKIAFERGCLRG